MIKAELKVTTIPVGAFDLIVEYLIPPVVSYSGERIRDIAQLNVTPGIGPGPHPHPGRQDTGDLLRATDFEVTRVNHMRWTAIVGPRTDAPFSGTIPPSAYGLKLETGWHSTAGRFWQYPWLRPALLNSRMYIMSLIVEIAFELTRKLDRILRRSY